MPWSSSRLASLLAGRALQQISRSRRAHGTKATREELVLDRLQTQTSHAVDGNVAKCHTPICFREALVSLAALFRAPAQLLLQLRARQSRVKSFRPWLRGFARFSFVDAPGRVARQHRQLSAPFAMSSPSTIEFSAFDRKVCAERHRSDSAPQCTAGAASKAAVPPSRERAAYNVPNSMTR